MLRLQDFWDMPKSLANSRLMEAKEKMLLAAVLYAYKQGCYNPSTEILFANTGTTAETLVKLEKRGFVFTNKKGTAVNAIDLDAMEVLGVIENGDVRRIERERERNMRNREL